jgi:hypothetical protein
MFQDGTPHKRSFPVLRDCPRDVVTYNQHGSLMTMDQNCDFLK